MFRGARNLTRAVPIVIAVVAGCGPCGKVLPGEPGRDAASDASVEAAMEAAAEAAATLDADACAPREAHQIADRQCTKNADCVLTDAPAECDACNLERVYPTVASALARRNAACALEAGAPSCKPQGCPQRDTYTGAFYRAECRNQRCIAYRYHSGG